MVLPRPSGTVTFLFTDVEGSTRLWDSDSDAMASSLALHDDILRTSVADHHGYVFSTGGDGFGVAFPTAEEAIEAALESQLSMSAASWPGQVIKVRMGIHSGTAEERDGDYFGPEPNRAARIMSAGHGGQVLVSSATEALVRHVSSIELRDLKTHSLKDIADPERIFELRHPDLPEVDAPIRIDGERSDNLPDYLNSFVGRERELDLLVASISDHRLTVMTGVGGTGKTRLAVEGARSLLGLFDDGVWLAELGQVTDPQRVMSAIGDLWALRPSDTSSIEEVVTRFLNDRKLLLLVDNCEHVLDGAARAIHLILESSPEVKVLATSRESLGIMGEMTFPVLSLGLPDEAHPLESESVQLFLDRAALVRPDFSPEAHHLQAIARICARIDGIPLGLELAAARLRALSVQELADRLEDSFRILSGSAKTALPRQRTLHATIGWSYDLLEPEEAAVFRRASLFVGGFDLESAEVVCSGDGVDEIEVLDLIDSLVDKSLVAALPQRSGTRYRMLEPVRQYAQEALSASGESPQVRQDHARHFAAVVAAAAPRTRSADQMDQVHRLSQDLGNIRVAFITLLDTDDIDLYLGTSFDLFAFWMITGRHVEGIETGLAGLQGGSGTAGVDRQVKAWWAVSNLSAQISSLDAVEYGRAGQAVAERGDDVDAKRMIGLAMGPVGARDRHEYLESLAAARPLLDGAEPSLQWWERDWEQGFINFLYVSYLPPDHAGVRGHFDTAIEAFTRAGDEVMVAATHTFTLLHLGNQDEKWIMDSLLAAVEILDWVEAPYWHGHAQMYLGSLLSFRGSHADAAPHLSRARRRLADCGDLFCWTMSTRGLGVAEAEMGNTDQARQLMATALDSIPELPMQEPMTARLLDAAAQVLTAAGNFEAAAVALGRAAVIPVPNPSIFDREGTHETIRTSVVEHLGEDRANRLIDQGAEMDLSESLSATAAALNSAD